MKTYPALLLSWLLAGCASSSRYDRGGRTAIPNSNPAAMGTYLQQQQPRPADAAPRYRRVTVTIPAHVEGGVRYEEQTRNILIAE